MPQYQSLMIPKAPQTMDYLVESSDSSSSSIEIQYMYPVEDLSEFVTSYIYQLNIIKMNIQSKDDYIQSCLDTFRIRQ